MSAVGTGAIGPVSVRYAAQIRELLFAQAIQRMAADQEAARAQADADRTARAEAAARAEPASQPLRAQLEISPPPLAIHAESSDQADTAGTEPAAHLIDIQA